MHDNDVIALVCDFAWVIVAQQQFWNFSISGECQIIAFEKFILSSVSTLNNEHDGVSECMDVQTIKL